jgi:hypothetical protein
MPLQQFRWYPCVVLISSRCLRCSVLFVGKVDCGEKIALQKWIYGGISSNSRCNVDSKTNGEIRDKPLIIFQLHTL